MDSNNQFFVIRNSELLNGYDKNSKFVILKDIINILPKRKMLSNKGDYGKLLCVVGSREMTGAAILSAKAAVKSGAGIVTVASPKSIIPVLQSNLIETIFMPLTENYLGSISLTSIDTLIQKCHHSNACLIGCGLGNNVVTEAIIEELISKTKIPMIIDADALNGISKNTYMLKKVISRGNMILTPHPGEMAKLCNTTVEEIQKNRIGYARKFARVYNVILILKGAYTITATPKGKVYINTTGNPGMAKGGSGDVLAGIISSFVTQGISLEEAAVAGVYIHGLAGDMAAKRLSQYAMTPSDIINHLYLVFSKLTK